MRLFFGCILAFLFLGLSPAHADIRYVYDEAGRLVEVIDAAGNSAIYRYDAAGNILSITRKVAGDVAIAEFTPDRGPVGSPVTISGVGFSATASANTVKFNGISATVTSATSTTLVVTVPTGATTGLITVTVGVKTATSATPFTVTTTIFNGPPVITSFSPRIAAPGAAVTIVGSNFESAPINNFVHFNFTPATVGGSTTTRINTTVPTGATSGPIKVRTATGTAISSADFFVVPEGYSASSVSVARRIAVDGAPLSINTGSPGKIALVLFNGTQGQYLGLGFSPVTLTGDSATLAIKTPSGADLISPVNLSPASSIDLPRLPDTGTYTMVIAPSASSLLTVTLTLSADITGTLTADGVMKTFNTTRVGQNARYTFAGTAGQNLRLVLHGDTFPGYTYVSVFGPNGVVWTLPYLHYDGGLASGATWDLPVLPATGSYTVFITPTERATGGLSMALWGQATGTVVVDGVAKAVNLPLGRHGRYTFSGTAGQALGLGINSLVTTPTGKSIAVQVYKPDGTVLKDCGQASAPGSSCDLPLLPLAGTYSIGVDPGVSGAVFNLWLSTDVTGTLLPTGAPLAFTTTRVGQNARYTFAGTAGQNLSIALSGDTFPGYTYVYVSNPNGEAWTSTYVHYTSGSGSTALLDLVTLPATGTYTVFITPEGTATGTLTTALWTDVTGTVTIDGTATAASVPIGRDGRYTFTGTAGQGLGLGITDLVTTPVNNYVYVKVLKPDQSVLLDCGGLYHGYGGGSCDLPLLPVSGVYTVLLDPSSAAATLKLWLSTDVTGTLAANGAAQTFTTTRVGQNARYTFAGTTGKPLSLVLSGDTFPGTTYVYIYQPNGSLWTQTSLSAGGSDVFLELNPSTTGTYKVLITPESTATGALTTTLWTDVAGTVTIDGAATAASVPIGRDGRYTFTGTAGQRLGLGMTALVTAPANNYVYAKVLKPDQSVLLDCGGLYHGYSGGRCNPLLVPTSGVYTVLLDPSAAAATLKLWLSTEVTGTLAANGTAQTFATTRVGQNARYTFAGTTGKPLSLVLSGDTFPGTTYVYVYQPNGSLWSQTSLYYDSGAGSSTLLSLNPPASGTYTVLITPEGTATGTLTTALLADVTGTVTLNGAATTVSVPLGHDGRYTFTGTAGQGLGLGITDLVTTPVNNYVYVKVLKPDQSVLLDCGGLYHGYGGGSCDLPLLPVSGVYTVLLDPSSAAATLKLWLSTDVTGTLAANGAAQTFTTTRVGQNARYTFAGTTGKPLSLVLSGDTFPGTTYVYVYQPNGSLWSQASLYYDSGAGSSTLLSLNPPASGTYRVLITPEGTATGTLTTTLLADVTGTLPLNGAAIMASVPPGHDGRYTFTGTVGKVLSLSITDPVTIPPDGYISITVQKPDQSTLVDCSVSHGASRSCDLPALPVAGVYTVLVNPSASAATLKLWLSADVIGTVAINGVATVVSAPFGRDGRYTFTGTAGQALGLGITEPVTTPPNGSISITVQKPDQSILLDCSVWHGAGTSCDLPVLAVTGVYTIVVDPGFAAATLKLWLSTDVTGTLPTDGAATTFTTARAGQNARYTFAGTAGQDLQLLLSGDTFPGDTEVYVYEPNGNLWTWTSLFYASGSGSTDVLYLWGLPATGTYTVFITPTGSATGSISTRLLTP